MVSLSASAAQQELAHLRTALMAGRGPGASGPEIAAHTSDRRWLGGLPSAQELEKVARQARLARIGATFTSASAIGRLLDHAVRIAAICAAVVLVLRSVFRGSVRK